MKRMIAIVLLCWCAGFAAPGKAMTIMKNAAPPQRIPVVDIDSLTYGGGPTPALRMHHAASMIATQLSNVDSVVFSDLPPYEVTPSAAYTYDVGLDRVTFLNFGIVAWGPNWAWFGTDGTESTTLTGQRQVVGTNTIGGTSAALTINHTARAVSLREFELTFTLSVNGTVNGAYIVSSLNLAESFFGKGKAYAWSGGAIADTSATGFPRGALGGMFDSITCIGNNGDTTTITFAGRTQVNTDGGCRVKISRDTMTAGNTYTTTMRVRLPGEMTFYPSLIGSYQYGQNAEWFPFSVGDSGTPVDLSFLNKNASGAWVPAGGHGFLRAVADSFVFDDGTPGRFWGVNVTAGGCKGSNARSLQIAQRLARLGVNVARLHHLDSWWTASNIDVDHSDGTTQHLDSVNMERLDRFIYELKSHGIYIVLDPWVGRQFRAGDSVPGWEDMTGNFGLHPYVYFDARIQQLTKLYWQQIWTHVNPYTGLAYKDDPAIILTEVINEGLTGGPTLEPYRTNYLAMYKAWARANAADTNLNPINNNFDPQSIRFYTHYTDSFYSAMYAYLRGVGVRVPISYNNWSFWNWEPPTLAKADYMDMHHYYGGDVIGAGNAMGGVWAQHGIFAKSTPWGKIAKHAVYGKPVMSSECGQNTPKIYRGAYYPSFAAEACLQGWDCITGYAYTQGGGPSNSFNGQFLGAYEWESDPATIAGLAAGALIYRRQDVKLASETVVMHVPQSEVLALHWENGGEKATENLPKFNAMLETHRVVCVYGDSVPTAVAALDRLDVNNAFNYSPPNTELRSDRNELWRDWNKGVGTINTPRTQSAFGMLAGQALSTRSCSFVINNPYASVVLSSLTGDSIPASSKLLIIASAEAKNTGMAYNLLRTSVTVTGTAPVIAEPVTGTVSFTTSKTSLTLYPISISGVRKAGVSIPVVNGTAVVALKAEYKTLFYEIE